MSHVLRAGRLLATAAAVAVAVAACTGGGTKLNRLALVTSRSPGTDAFTTDVGYTAVDETQATSVTLPSTVGTALQSSSAAAAAAATTTSTTSAPSTTLGAAGTPAPTSVTGTLPGLYGGTRDQSSCNVEQLVTFLTQHPDKGKAWAVSQGIAQDQIGSFIHSLTPVVLLHDTHVTNHGFRGGKANAYQAVLQAGTAVLVDQNGVPRARCACGNPLLGPATASPTETTGTPWRGYGPGHVVIVQPGPPTDHFTLVDPGNGQSFDRPSGGRGTDTQTPPTTATTTTGGSAKEIVYEGSTFTNLPPIDLPVPFLIEHTGAHLNGDIYDYLLDDLLLKPAGRYSVSADSPGGGHWKVRIHPLGPLLYDKKGSGGASTRLPGIPTNLPDTVGVELLGNGRAGDFYLTGKAGLVDSETIVRSTSVVDLSIVDYKNAGWEVRIWGMPAGCGFANAAATSVTCA